MSFLKTTDMLGRQVVLPTPPQRIISLVPSQTELLMDLGLENQLVGRTKFCIHPKQKVKSIKIVGGTKNLHFDQIKVLQPDLIIANKEENNKEDIEQLESSYPVWVSNVTDLATALQMINMLGIICNREEKSQIIVQEIAANFNDLQIRPLIPALYFIWRKPYMLAGSDTFIHEMMQKAGFQNLIQEDRYPTYDMEQLKKFTPSQVLLSSEPYPFKEKHIQEIQTIFPQATIQLVDGELFSWYGSRLLRSANYFKKLRKQLKNG